MMDKDNEIGDILLVRGIITLAQLDDAVQIQRAGGKPIADVLLERGYVSRNELNQHISDLMKENLLSLLQPLFALKLVVSDFYYMCAEKFPGAAEFWIQMGNDEVRHYLYIGQIIEALYERPQLFAQAQPCAPQVVSRLISSVQNAHFRVKNEHLSAADALGFAHDFETGMLESGLFDLPATRDEEARKLIDILRDETQFHRQRIIDAATKNPER